MPWSEVQPAVAALALILSDLTHAAQEATPHEQETSQEQQDFHEAALNQLATDYQSSQQDAASHEASQAADKAAEQAAEDEVDGSPGSAESSQPLSSEAADSQDELEALDAFEEASLPDAEDFIPFEEPPEAAEAPLAADLARPESAAVDIGAYGEGQVGPASAMPDLAEQGQLEQQEAADVAVKQEASAAARGAEHAQEAAAAQPDAGLQTHAGAGGDATPEVEDGEPSELPIRKVTTR